MEYQKITNLLDNIPDKVPRFITKEWIEVHNQSSIAEDRYKPNKQIRCKTSIIDQICVITVMHILLKKKVLLQIQIIMHITRN